MILKLNNPLDQCQLKFASDEKGEFEGYASVFNGDDAVNDTIVPGAYAKSIERGSKMPLFINHQHNDLPVGSVELKEDSHGLHSRGFINLAMERGREAYSAAKRGDIDALSVGFTMAAHDFTRKKGGGRIITNMDLREVSLVTFPADDSARILGVKADDMLMLGSLRDCEDYLRESGGAKQWACAFVSHVSKLARGEPVTIADKSQRVEAVTNRIIQLLNG